MEMGKTGRSEVAAASRPQGLRVKPKKECDLKRSAQARDPGRGDDQDVSTSWAVWSGAANKEAAPTGKGRGRDTERDASVKELPGPAVATWR